MGEDETDSSGRLRTDVFHSSFDAFLPVEMARRAEKIGVAKVKLSCMKMFLLAVLAGAFIALGAIFSTTATTGGDLPFGLTRLLAGFTFSLGLILVVVAGAELFTGNNLVVMALASRRISLGQLLKNWTVVYLGNFAGAITTAGIVFLARQFEQGGGAVGRNAVAIANAKCQLDLVEAFFLGALCNALVCLAIWLCYSARSTTDKILSIVFPITAFVAAGFEHSIANMYFIPIGILIKSSGSDTVQIADSLADLTWTNFLLANLVPVTLGNIVGGSVMVGLVYWFIHLRNHDAQ